MTHQGKTFTLPHTYRGPVTSVLSEVLYGRGFQSFICVPPNIIMLMRGKPIQNVKDIYMVSCMKTQFILRTMNIINMFKTLF